MSRASSVEPRRFSRAGVPTLNRLRPLSRPLLPVAVRRMARLAVRRLTRRSPPQRPRRTALRLRRHCCGLLCPCGLHCRRAALLAAFTRRTPLTPLAPLAPLARWLPVRLWRCRLWLIRHTLHPLPRRRKLFSCLLPPCCILRPRRHCRSYHCIRRRRRLDQRAATAGPALEAPASLQVSVSRRQLGGPVLIGARRCHRCGCAPCAADVVGYGAEHRRQPCRGESRYDELGRRPLGRHFLGCAAHRKGRC